MATPLEQRKTIFNNGVPKYTAPRLEEYSTKLSKEFGGQPTPSVLTTKATTLGTTAKSTGIFDPRNIPPKPIPKTYQEIVQIGQNELVQRLNTYNYNERRNDILQLGDSRGRGQKYPPEILLHTTGGPGYPGKDVDDMFVRGGIVQSTAIALEDVARITNFFASPKGFLWIVREQGLQMTNPRPETRFFSPANILLNTTLQHLGAHLTRHGINPFSEGGGTSALDFGYNTYSTVKDYEYGDKGGKTYTAVPFVGIPRTQPKLLDMVSELQLGKKGVNLTSINPIDILGMFGFPGTNVAGYISPKDKPAGGPEISTISYLAAANAPYGGFSLFGGGMHRSANTQLDTDGLGIYKYPRSGDSGASMLLGQAMQLINNPVGALTGVASSLLDSVVGSALGDVASALSLPVPGGSSMPSPSLEVLKTYKTLAYGELGLSTKLYVSTERDTLEGPSQNYKVYAKISSLKRKASKRTSMLTSRGFSDPGSSAAGVFDMTNSQAPIKGEVKGGDNPYDLVPLIFYDIAKDTSIVFRAVLSGITDTFSPEWNEYNYVGNPQTYYTYKRTTRDFGFTFKVYTDTERELRWNWMKLNRFVGMVYPSFTSSQRMIGPLVRLTLGDILWRMPGYISALTMTVDDNTPWEINLFKDEKLARVPHVIECAVTYRVIGDEPLDGRTTKFYMQNKMGTGQWQEKNWSN
jgi:hypothetical protein